MRPRLRVLFDEAMIGHDPGRFHPERPDRLCAVADRLEAAGLEGLEWRRPPRATVDQLGRIHDRAYIEEIRRKRGQSARLDADTVLSPGSVEAAFLAAGAALDGVTAVVSGEASTALALVRPPGHHAERAHAMGFCVFNNLAVAAAHAVADLGVRRVLVVDWDVHHGNGTQHAFETSKAVLFFSIHRYPFYPGSGGIEEIGTGEGLGYTLNVPLAAGAGDGDYQAVFDAVLVPVAAHFAPELVLVSAGFDSHARDPLGGMAVSTEGFASLCQTVKAIADRHAAGRVVLILEGGYDLVALAESIVACAGVLCGHPAPCKSPVATGSATATIAAVREAHRAFWGLDA